MSTYVNMCAILTFCELKNTVISVFHIHNIYFNASSPANNVLKILLKMIWVHVLRCNYNFTLF